MSLGAPLSAGPGALTSMMVPAVISGMSAADGGVGFIGPDEGDGSGRSSCGGGEGGVVVGVGHSTTPGTVAGLGVPQVGFGTVSASALDVPRTVTTTSTVEETAARITHANRDPLIGTRRYTNRLVVSRKAAAVERRRGEAWPRSRITYA